MKSTSDDRGYASMPAGSDDTTDPSNPRSEGTGCRAPKNGCLARGCEPKQNPRLNATYDVGRRGANDMSPRSPAFNETYGVPGPRVVRGSPLNTTYDVQQEPRIYPSPSFGRPGTSNGSPRSAAFNETYGVPGPRAVRGSPLNTTYDVPEQPRIYPSSSSFGRPGITDGRPRSSAFNDTYDRPGRRLADRTHTLVSHDPITGITRHQTFRDPTPPPHRNDDGSLKIDLFGRTRFDEMVDCELLYDDAMPEQQGGWTMPCTSTPCRSRSDAYRLQSRMNGYSDGSGLPSPVRGRTGTGWNIENLSYGNATSAGRNSFYDSRPPNASSNGPIHQDSDGGQYRQCMSYTMMTQGSNDDSSYRNAVSDPGPPRHRRMNDTPPQCPFSGSQNRMPCTSTPCRSRRDAYGLQSRMDGYSDGYGLPSPVHGRTGTGWNIENLSYGNATSAGRNSFYDSRPPNASNQDSDGGQYRQCMSYTMMTQGSSDDSPYRNAVSDPGPPRHRLGNDTPRRSYDTDNARASPNDSPPYRPDRMPCTSTPRRSRRDTLDASRSGFARMQGFSDGSGLPSPVLGRSGTGWDIGNPLYGDATPGGRNSYHDSRPMNTNSPMDGTDSVRYRQCLSNTMMTQGSDDSPLYRKTF